MPRPQVQQTHRSKSLIQVFSVARNHPTIPPEAVLAQAVQRAVALVVHVHVDEPVALGDLTGSGRAQVDGTLRGVAKDVDTILHHELVLGAQAALHVKVGGYVVGVVDVVKELEVRTFGQLAVERDGVALALCVDKVDGRTPVTDSTSA